MSRTRIYLPLLDPAAHPGREVCIGWDQDLETYYARVMDRIGAGSGNVRLDIGTTRAALTRPEEVISKVQPFATISDPAGLVRALMAHRVYGGMVTVDLRPLGERVHAAAAGRPSDMTALLGSSVCVPVAKVSGIEAELNRLALTEQHWELATYNPILYPAGGFTETYHRDGQELTLGYVSYDGALYLISPMKLDGRTQVITSLDDIRGLAARHVPTVGPIHGMDDAIMQLLYDVLGHGEQIQDHTGAVSNDEPGTRLDGTGADNDHSVGSADEGDDDGEGEDTGRLGLGY